MSGSIDDLYGRIGESGLRRVVGGFYRRVPADPVLGPMYPRRKNWRPPNSGCTADQSA